MTRLREHEVTPEAAWLDRRRFFRGAAAMALAPSIGSAASCRYDHPIQTTYAWTLPPFEADTRTPPGPLTEELHAASYNNFYEFSEQKDEVWRRAGTLRPRPWSVTVSGACHRPEVFDLETLLKLPLVERIYRFRCVEAWSMVVPWIGFPLATLLSRVEPLGSARYVRLFTLDDPEQLPGLREMNWYPWPYFEALRLDEALHPLTLLAVGIYGHPLPNQHGAPIRLVVPWKYGYKNIKSIVRIELTETEPETFWHRVVPEEYDRLGNVEPTVPHPRWSQAIERVIPMGTHRRTERFNGYGAEVAAMYR